MLRLADVRPAALRFLHLLGLNISVKSHCAFCAIKKALVGGEKVLIHDFSLFNQDITFFGLYRGRLDIFFFHTDTAKG
jgi:hypothetical protein